MVRKHEPYRHPIPRPEEDDRYERENEEEQVNYFDLVSTPEDNSWDEFQNDMDMIEDMWEDSDNDDESF